MEVIKLSASWCGPCRVYAPTFEKVSKMEEFKNIIFSEIDVEENPEIAEKYKIRNVPCTLIITDTDTIRLAGLQTEENLCNEIRKML
jgi:thioredoxin 1